jgi:hypothetical protein
LQETSLENKGDTSTLADIYPRLAVDREDFQHNWEVSTLKVLDQLDEDVSVEESMENLIDQTVIATLRPLLGESQIDTPSDDLRAAFAAAMNLGRKAERDRSPVYVATAPSMKDHRGWKEDLSEYFDMGDAIDISTTSPTFLLDPLFVRPKIFRKSERMAPASSGTTVVGKANVDVIQVGLALFPNTGNLKRERWIGR